MMTLSVEQLIQLISTFIWPSIRISGMTLTLPFLSSATIPVRIRVIFVLSMASVVAPLYPDMPSISHFNYQTLVSIGYEFVLGLAMGTIIQFVFQAFVVGGQIVSMQAGFGFAVLVDPSSKASVPLLSQFYLMLVMLVFLSINGHLLMIDILVKSFSTHPVGGYQLTSSLFWQVIAFSTWMFKGAVLMALPVIISLLVVSLSFGIMMKAAPQINIFSVGFPLTLILGIVIVCISLYSILPHVNLLMDEAIKVIKGMVL